MKLGMVLSIGVLFLLFGVCQANNGYLKGKGTCGDPYMLEDLEDFEIYISSSGFWDDYVSLECDIDLCGRVFDHALIAYDIDDDQDHFQGSGFSGVFYGNGHTIRNFVVDNANKDYAGLFGYSEGEILDLKVEGLQVTGRRWVGGLVGDTRNLVWNCCAIGEVNGELWVGGLAGANWFGDILCSFSYANVIGVYAGGLAGLNVDMIYNCYSTGKVNSDVYSEGVIGGLVGENYLGGTVWNCYSCCDVGGGYYCGGMIGYVDWWSVSSNCWCADACGYSLWSAGNVMDECQGIYAKSNSQMRTKSTYTDMGWEFGDDDWYMVEGNFPILSWQMNGKDLNHDGGVNMKDFSFLASKWGMDDCNGEDDCGEADINLSGEVDVEDMRLLSQNWLNSES